VISRYPSANDIGANITVTPAARALAAACDVLASMFVLSITGFTPACNAPPSLVKSF
jgi:hypothetical protein